MRPIEIPELSYDGDSVLSFRSGMWMLEMQGGVCSHV